MRFLARAMIPGVQKPHCNPPASIKLSAKVSRSSSLKPSRVRTDFPATLFAGTAQETTARPSMITVQQPHWPCGLQPSFGEMTPQWSRSASRRDIPSSISTARVAEFNVNSTRSPISSYLLQFRGFRRLFVSYVSHDILTRSDQSLAEESASVHRGVKFKRRGQK